MKTKSKSKAAKKSRRKPSELPGGNCRLLAKFLNDNQMSQREFAKKTGIKEYQFSRMNTATYVPTEEDQKKMISAGMTEQDVKAFVKAIRRFKVKTSGKKVSVKKHSKPAPKAESKRTTKSDDSISKEGVAVLHRIANRHKGKIPTDLAIIIMEECS